MTMRHRSATSAMGSDPTALTHVPARWADLERLRWMLSHAAPDSLENWAGLDGLRPIRRPHQRAGSARVALPALTAAATRLAADSGSSCSHTRMTVQPASANRASVSRSRVAFLSSFSRHHSALARGQLQCSGHACQKHESTITATRAAANSKSARRRTPGSGSRASTR